MSKFLCIYLKDGFLPKHFIVHICMWALLTSLNLLDTLRGCITEKALINFMQIVLCSQGTTILWGKCLEISLLIWRLKDRYFTPFYPERVQTYAVYPRIKDTISWRGCTEVIIYLLCFCCLKRVCTSHQEYEFHMTREAQEVQNMKWRREHYSLAC